MTERHAFGVLDTSVVIDLAEIPEHLLPHWHGSLAALMVMAGRSPRARRNDLMIAATAAVHNLPLYTRNAADFNGLEDAVNIVSA